MPSTSSEERQDSQRNRADIRQAIAKIIRKKMRMPTVQELVAATGLSDKTVARHLERVKLGNGEPNVFQALSSEVLLKLYERAVGYSHDDIKIMTTSITGVGSQIEEVPFTKHYAPDVAAAKLFFQLVEGYREKTETKVDMPTGFHFTYQAPAPPEPDGD
jgi:hypothetical protein